ncbi:uncharacterized protein V6R79_001163 [Siganus canaliculatus]
MAASKTSAWDGWCASQLNIILLGGRNSGKSSLGNLILGKEEFVTKERTSCSWRLGIVFGRWLTVVDTPGWWCDFSVQDTSELVKREIINSASLCSPGPHVFLITIKVSSAFSEQRRRAVEEHVALLGEGVWSHCIVVLCTADRFRHTDEGTLARMDGKALRWLTDKCSQRCHTVVLNDATGVTELLKKIERLVTENGNKAFEMRESISQVTAEEKKRAEERARQRFLRMKKERSLRRERLQPVTNIRIVLMGAKGSGKTSTFNTILNRNGNQPVRRTAQCEVGHAVVFGRQLTVVDTPGWWMNYFCEESPIFDRREMAFSLSLCPPGPHVFLLVLRMDRTFRETYRRAVQEHLQMISEHIWSRVIVLFSFGDWLGDTTTEQCIESEGEPLRWLVERCGNRYHVLNNKTRGDGFQVRELISKIEEMLAGTSGGHHFEIERRVIEQMEGEMRREREKAKERLMRKKDRKQMARPQLEKLNPLPELRLVLVGGRKTGKSSCGNTILSRTYFHTDTQTTCCSEGQVKIGGKTVSVLDTVGCFSVTPDLLVPSCALLLVVNASSSFKDTHREALENQLEAGGGQVWSRAVVLFSHGDWLGDTNMELRIESEGGPLRRLLDKCGNRYHVLDNKHGGDAAQVQELIELIEEMLAEERLAEVHRGDALCQSVSSTGEQLREAARLCGRDLKALKSHRPLLLSNSPDSASSAAESSLTCSEGGGQMVAVAAGRPPGRNGFMVDTSCLASLFPGEHRLRWSVNLPVWFPADDLHFRLDGGCQVHLLSCPAHPAQLPALPQSQGRLLPAQNGISVKSLLHPVLRERTFRRLSESAGLQALIDRWDHNSLEELEAFIDSYFEMVWEQTMESVQPPETDPPVTEQQSVLEEAGREQILSSIDGKLSKLELLEEIRNELVELRTSLEHSRKAVQEHVEKNKPEDSKC